MATQMQAIFSGNSAAIKSFSTNLSAPRLARYLNDSNHDLDQALSLYHWNAQLSQAMYLPLQIWEVTLRNKLNAFLIWKYGVSWPHDARLRTVLPSEETRRLNKTILDNTKPGSSAQVPTDVIVADLSAGFWVGLLGPKCDIAFGWHKHLGRVFPHDLTLVRKDVFEMCGDVLRLRNRVAHHEPIYALRLGDLRADVDDLLYWMCEGSHLYSKATCTFSPLWNNAPAPPAPPAPVVGDA